MSIDETTVEAIKSAIASFDEGELNGWELGVLLARAERDAVKLRSQEARIAQLEADNLQVDKAYQDLHDELEKRTRKLIRTETKLEKERSDICCYLLDIRDLQADLAQKEARLLAAEELAKYVEKHLNYQDTSVPSLLQAYRAAGKG